MDNQIPFSLGIIELGILSFGFMVFIGLVFAYWRIVAKTGNSGVLSLLMLIPFINLIFIIWLAFSEWPIERRMKELESNQIRYR